MGAWLVLSAASRQRRWSVSPDGGNGRRAGLTRPCIEDGRRNNRNCVEGGRLWREASG